MTVEVFPAATNNSERMIERMNENLCKVFKFLQVLLL